MHWRSENYWTIGTTSLLPEGDLLLGWRPCTMPRTLPVRLVRASRYMPFLWWRRRLAKPSTIESRVKLSCVIDDLVVSAVVAFILPYVLQALQRTQTGGRTCVFETSPNYLRRMIFNVLCPSHSAVGASEQPCDHVSETESRVIPTLSVPDWQHAFQAMHLGCKALVLS